MTSSRDECSVSSVKVRPSHMHRLALAAGDLERVYQEKYDAALADCDERMGFADHDGRYFDGTLFSEHHLPEDLQAMSNLLKWLDSTLPGLRSTTTNTSEESCDV